MLVRKRNQNALVINEDDRRVLTEVDLGDEKGRRVVLRFKKIGVVVGNHYHLKTTERIVAVPCSRGQSEICLVSCVLREDGGDVNLAIMYAADSIVVKPRVAHIFTPLVVCELWITMDTSPFDPNDTIPSDLEI